MAGPQQESIMHTPLLQAGCAPATPMLGLTQLQTHCALCKTTLSI